MRRGPLVLAAAGAGAAALIALELARGGAGYGETRLHDPCTPRTAGASAGAGLVLRGLDPLACGLGVTREELLLNAADSPLGSIAAGVPNLRRSLEHWLEQSLAGRRPLRPADGAERAIFRALDQLYRP